MAIEAQAEGLVLVTGTDTGVGKTVVTAAIAAAAGAAGRRVAVVKPAQTGTAAGEPTDVAEVVRLADPAHAVTLAEYPEPLAPLIAARFASAEPLRLRDARDAVRALVEAYDLVLVEGAGGLRVPMGEASQREPWTLAALRDASGREGATAVVVARAGLGTLNHTALTLEALERDAIPASTVIGAWPALPGRVHWANLAEFLSRGSGSALAVAELVGVLPEGAGQMEAEAFRRTAPGWLTPQYYGTVTGWMTHTHAWLAPAR